MLEEMFENMRTKSKWNVDGELLWGYFFTDKSRKKLHRAAEALEKMGYETVGVFQDESKTFYWLHVERVEKHDVNSLEKRNAELEKFAAEAGLESYDGMDACEVPQDVEDA